MARDYARIMTVIWKNREFRALHEAEQRVYLLLVTQPDIDAAGVLRVSLDWWADMAVDSTPEAIAGSLSKLEQGRFIGLDRLTGEVLIRSFIRWDGGHHNPKRRPVIARAVDEVRSDRLVEMIGGELRRVGAPELMPDRQPGALSADHESDLSEYPDEDDAGDPNEFTSSQVEWLPGSEPGSEPGSRLVTTSVGSRETATNNPGTTTQPARRAERDGADAADAALEIDDGFEEFWALYPRKAKKVDAKKAWRSVIRRKVHHTRVIQAARAHAAAWLLEGKEQRFIPYPASWLRAGAYDDIPELPRDPPPAGRHLAVAQQGTASQRSNAFLALRKGGEPA